MAICNAINFVLNCHSRRKKGRGFGSILNREVIEDSEDRLDSSKPNKYWLSMLFISLTFSGIQTLRVMAGYYSARALSLILIAQPSNIPNTLIADLILALIKVARLLARVKSNTKPDGGIEPLLH